MKTMLINFVLITLCLLLRVIAVSQTNAEIINERIGKGINLGNALDAPVEGEWGIILEEKYFAEIADAGFNSVRIPVRWDTHSDDESPYTIEPVFMDRVVWAVDQALKYKLTAVINMHHYDSLAENPEKEHDRFISMWGQIAEQFKDYPDSLVFEILNFPSVNLTSDVWNVYQAEALGEIRKTNPDRVAVLNFLDWEIEDNISKIKIPEGEEENVILKFHFYNPIEFTGQNASWIDGADEWLGNTWDSTSVEVDKINEFLENIKTKTDEISIPVYVSEFGAIKYADIHSRARWASHCKTMFEEHGFSWSYWAFTAEFDAYNLNNSKWIPEILEALLDTVIAGTPINEIVDGLYVVDNFEYGNDNSPATGGWNLYDGAPVGEDPYLQQLNDAPFIVEGGADGSNYSAKLDYVMRDKNSWAGALHYIDTDYVPVDLKYSAGVQITYKGSAFSIRTIANEMHNSHVVSVPAADEWTVFFAKWDQFQPMNASVSLDQADVDGFLIQIGASANESGTLSFDNLSLVYVDNSILNGLITDATEMYEGAVVGNDPGQYTVSAKDDFLHAINTAKVISEDSDVGYEEYSEAYLVLENQISQFLMSTEGVLFDDCDDGNEYNKFGGKWSVFTDNGNGGLSTVHPDVDMFKMTPKTVDASDYGAGISFVFDKGDYPYAPFVGLATKLTYEGTEFDLSSSHGVEFLYKGYPCQFSVDLSTTIIDYDVHFVSVPQTDEWTKYSFSWSEFGQAGWGKPYPFDLTKSLFLKFNVLGADGDVGKIMVDDIKLIGLDTVPEPPESLPVEKVSAGFTIYPQPVSDILNIVSELDSEYSICIFSSDSRLVFESIAEGNSQINVVMLAKGTYVLQLKTDNAFMSIPFIKE